MHDNDIHQTSHWTLIITWYLYHQFLIFNPTFMWKSMFSCISKNLWGLSYLGWNQLHSVSQPHDTAFEDCSSYNLEWYSNLIGEDYGCNFVFNMVAKLHGFFFYLYLHNFVLIKIWQQFKNAQTIFLYTFLSLLNLMVTILINFQTFLARGVLTSNYRKTVEFLIAC